VIRSLRVLSLALCTVQATAVFAQGHGPVYGLSTPTLRRGGWSTDNGFMGQIVGEHEMVMFRPMVSYGITEHVQLSASLPVPVYTSQGMAPARIARYESTAYLALDYPTDATRMALRTAPGVMGALATGYVSRSLYAWAGGLYRRYVTPIGATADHTGDVAMVSAVLGLRPPSMQYEYPHADWRLFIEGVGEITQRSVAAGVPVVSTGGHQYFVGPTLLGLYGGWGVSGGPLFPVYQQLNGAQRRDKVRLALDVVTWF